MCNFGEYLKELRKERNLTVRKLAEESGISHSYITNVENGKRGVPSPDVLEKITKTLSQYAWLSYAEVLQKAGYKVLAKGVQLKEAGIDFANSEIERRYGQQAINDLVEFELMANHLGDIKTFLSKDYEPDNFGYDPDEGSTTPILPKYNGHKLTDSDRQRILAMLEILFPDYQERGRD